MVAAAAAGALLPLAVAASSSITPHTEVDLPLRWSGPQILALIMLLLLMPPMIASSVMLWRMRHRYPIAGRGAHALLFIQWSVLVMVLATTFAVLIYDGNTACGMSWTIAHISIDLIALPYLTRGWTLVVRLEIQSYLEEKQWREQNKVESRKIQAEANGAAEQRSSSQKIKTEPTGEQQLKDGAITAGAGDGKDDGTRAARTRVPDDGGNPDADAPIPGLWYLAHRSLIRPAAIGRMWLSLALLVLVSCVAVAVFDPDVKATQAALRAQGYNTTVLSSAFTPDEFLFGPPCLSNSVKMLQFEAVLCLLVLPAAVWMTYKMAQINKRKKKRMHEQRLATLEEQRKEQQSNGVQRAVTFADADAAAAGSALSDLSQHDSDRVQLEFGFVCVITVVGISSYAALQVLAPHFHSFALLSAAIALWIVSIVAPIRDGIRISNRVKAMLSAGSDATGARSGKSIGDRRLPHHRPYFSLRYLLSRDHTFPVLLSFLQKEFSSENALFVIQANAFEAAAIKLQNSCATHWQLDAEEYEITIGGGGRGSGGSRTTATGLFSPQHHQQHQLQSTGARTSLVAAPSRLQMLRSPSLNLQGATVEEIDDRDEAEAEAETQQAYSSAADSSPLPGSANLDDSAATPVPPLAPGSAPSATPLRTPPRKALALRVSSYQLPDAAVQAPLASPSLGAQSHAHASPTGSPGSSTDGASGAGHGGAAVVSMVRISPILSAYSAHASGGQQDRGMTSVAAAPGSGVSHANGSPTLRCWNATVSPSSPTAAAAAVTAASASLLSGSAARAELARLVAWSSRIYSEFISASARFQVNLPEDVSRVLVAQCEALQNWAREALPAAPADDPTAAASSESPSSFPPAPPVLLSSLFRSAHREILDLLEKDSLRRFVLTPAHRALLQQADQKELQRIQKQQALQSAAQAVDVQLQRIGGELEVTAAAVVAVGRGDAVVAAASDDDDAAAATDAEDV